MTSKEYLETLKELKDYLLQEKQDLRSLRREAESLASMRYSSGKVQTSHTGKARYTTLVEEMADLEQRIHADTMKYSGMREEIIDQIQSIRNAKYADVLYRRYIEDQNCHQIAQAMGYSYSYIVHTHAKALKEFEAVYKENGT